MADPAANFPTSQDTYATLDGKNDILSGHPNGRANAIEAIEGFIGVSGAAQSHNATLLSLLRDNFVGGRCYKKDVDEIYIGAFYGIVTNAGDTIRKLRVKTSVTTLSETDIDTGSLAADTVYYIYATADSASTEPTFVFSANAATPTGYTYYRRIGWFYNESDGALDITSGWISNFLGGGNKNHIISSTVAAVVCNTTIPNDDTKPQSDEGVEVLTTPFVPSSTNSILKVTLSYLAGGSTSNSNSILFGVFKDDGADAIAAGGHPIGNTGVAVLHNHIFEIKISSVDSRIYKLRIGPDSNEATLNGDGAGSRLFGGAAISSMIIKEIVK